MATCRHTGERDFTYKYDFILKLYCFPVLVQMKENVNWCLIESKGRDKGEILKTPPSLWVCTSVAAPAGAEERNSTYCGCM